MAERIDRHRPRRLGGLAAACLLAACASVPNTSSNLDALLDSDDNLRHVAAVESAWRYNLRGLVDLRWLKGPGEAAGIKKREVGDPSYTALKYLLKLENPPGGSTRPAYQRMEQVRQFARYAVRCPGKLVRERALLALVPHGKRLGIAGPAAPDGDDQPAANAPELQSALAGLMQAAEPLLLAKERANETRLRDLEAAAEVLGSLHVDLDGGWRALRAISGLAGAADLSDSAFESVRVVAGNLERRLVELALASGLGDPDPYVRAAAVRATYSIVGEVFLNDLLRSLMGGGPEGFESAYGLRRENPADPEVFLAAYELVRANGLPESPGLGPIEARVERLEQLRGLLSVAGESELFADRPRTTAMLALAEVAPEGPGTLRSEDWTDWWQEWAPKEMEEVAAERSATEGLDR